MPERPYVVVEADHVCEHAGAALVLLQEFNGGSDRPEIDLRVVRIVAIQDEQVVEGGKALSDLRDVAIARSRNPHGAHRASRHKPIQADQPGVGRIAATRPLWLGDRPGPSPTQ